MATVSWTAVLSVVFAPLIVARLIVDRSKNAWALTVLWASGVWLQLSETVLGTSHHNVHGFNGLYFILRNFVTRVVPRALFGERSLGGAGVDYRGGTAIPLQITDMAAHNALIVCAWAVVVLIVVLAAFHTAVVQPRYVIAPALLLYTALVALMRPRLQKDATTDRAAVRRFPAAGFAVLLLVAVTLNFRVTNGRTTSPAWTSVVATARSDCAMPGVSAHTFVHEWWFVTIPCSEVG